MSAPPNSTSAFTVPDPEELESAALDGGRVDMNKVIDYIRRLIITIGRGMDKRSPDTSPMDGQLFVAPHGSIYKLHIDDSGGISITQLYDSGYGDPPPP